MYPTPESGPDEDICEEKSTKLGSNMTEAALHITLCDIFGAI